MSGDKDETYSQGSAEFCSQFHSGESELYSLTPCNDDIFCCLGLEASRARRFCWNRACRFASSVGEIGSPEQVRGYELCAGRPGPTFVKFVIKEASSHYNVTHWTRQQQWQLSWMYNIKGGMHFIMLPWCLCPDDTPQETNRWWSIKTSWPARCSCLLYFALFRYSNHSLGKRVLHLKKVMLSIWWGHEGTHLLRVSETTREYQHHGDPQATIVKLRRHAQSV